MNDRDAPSKLTTFGQQHEDFLRALKSIAKLAGQTLLGPDSRHHMGDSATLYYEQGANAAFEQAARIARDAIAKAVPLD